MDEQNQQNPQDEHNDRERKSKKNKRKNQDKRQGKSASLLSKGVSALGGGLKGLICGPVEQTVMLGIALLLLVIVFIMLPLRQHASEIGGGIGDIAGQATGIAVGSFQGLTQGLQKGADSGKQEGLSAKDTHVRIAASMKNVGNLQVLAASVKLSDFHKQGDKYAALYLLKGDMIFTVDLTRATVAIAENGAVTIMLPYPKSQLYVDETQTAKLDDYQKMLFNGESDAGYDAYLNSMIQIAKKSKEQIGNYDALEQQAKASAIRQVKLLAGNVLGANKTVRVSFTDEE